MHAEGTKRSRRERDRKKAKATQELDMNVFIKCKANIKVITYYALAIQARSAH